MFEQEFMKSHGLTMHEDHVGVHGSDAAAGALPETFITLVPGLSLLHIKGKDAGEFLHNQFTCDVNTLADGSGCPGAWCTPKGRAITTFLLYRSGAAFYLLLPAVLKERVVKRLRLYVLRADVTIEDLDAGRSILGARGRSGDIPENHREYSVHRLNDRLHLFLPDISASRCLIIDATPALQAVWEELSETMPPADSRCWARLDMESGIAWLNDATTEQFLPQELNLEDIGGLSFSKGCYPGQEIVARVHYRGQVKRRMLLARCETDSPPQPGTALRDDDGKNAGMLAGAVPTAAHDWLVQCVIDIAATDAGKINIENGPSLHIEPAIPSSSRD